MIVVDLTRVEQRELYKYMGREAAETFLTATRVATGH
jgi:hypothetical protein